MVAGLNLVFFWVFFGFIIIVLLVDSKSDFKSRLKTQLVFNKRFHSYLTHSPPSAPQALRMSRYKFIVTVIIKYYYLVLLLSIIIIIIIEHLFEKVACAIYRVNQFSVPVSAGLI